ncbi:hypothetical protein OHU34_02330 [Streptomyces sp. NBC_00080]|uniref:hypothetical protein n=1 Tax=unclassified Streptomyces TaxID=2593676 RepID=UPI0011693747|nr:hypothetical protein [Streptomyces sp. SLBN-115]TQJ37503.1 hypothetical protein FBY34_8331 [Streptomyces sp. SLBN-115]
MHTAGGEGDQEMRTFLAAATGLPTILLTAALVVVLCFWLLTAVGVAGVDSFDRDVDLRACRMGGVPVAVAFSVLTVLAWSLSVGAAVVVAVCAPPGPVTALLRMVVPVGALLVAWATTCLIVRPLHRLFPDEPALSVLCETRTGDGTGLRADGSRDPYGGASRDAVRPRDRAA